MTRRRPLVLMAAWLLPLALAGCASAPPTDARSEGVSPLAAGWGGLAPLADGRYLVVHDHKSHEPGARLSQFDPALQRLRTLPDPVRVEDWRDADGPSNDLEAVCALDGRRDEFLLAESGYFQGRYGRIFHVRVDGARARVLHVLRLPADAPGEPPANYEGLACRAISAGHWLLVLGERGGNAPRARGSIRLGRYRDGGPGIAWEATALPVRVPGSWPKGFDVRDIGDLALDPDGTLWAVGALDPGNHGPFRSTVWRMGWLDAGNPEAPLRLDPAPRNAWILDGLKVEAVAVPPAGMPRTRLLVATDDEDYGGIWRPLAEPVPEGAAGG